jgi:hypothetical protein
LSFEKDSKLKNLLNTLAEVAKHHNSLSVLVRALLSWRAEQLSLNTKSFEATGGLYGSLKAKAFVITFDSTQILGKN